MGEQQVMAKTGRAPTGNVSMCPHCQRDLSFVASWTFRGRWGYDEVHTYECREHGPIFVSAQAALGHGPDTRADKGPDSADHDSLVSAPRKPRPTLDADAIAVPEPDSN
jgi:hypothetical protein